MKTLLDFQSLNRDDTVDLPRRSDEVKKGDEVLVTGKRSRFFGMVGLVSGIRMNFDRWGGKQVAGYLVRGSSGLGVEWVGPADLRCISFSKSLVGISAGVIDVEGVDA